MFRSAGEPRWRRRGHNLTTGVALLDYDFEKSQMRAPPRRFLLMKPPPNGLDWSPGAIIQKVVGAAFGPDGLLYVTDQQNNARHGTPRRK